MLSLDGARVTVMGLGRFGGGLGVTRFLVAQGARVIVTDKLPSEQLGPQVESLGPELASGRLTPRLGRHDVADFTGADVVVANPAVPRPWDDPFLTAAARAGVAITTEIELLVERLPSGATVAAITGSAGKSTTTALTHHILERVFEGRGAGGARAYVGGNLGGSLLPVVGQMRDGDAVVLELSSAMLWWLGGAAELRGERAASCGLRPRVGVVTSISPNHIDWHGTTGHYERCKRCLLDMLGPGSLAILGPGATGWGTPVGVERLEMDGSGEAGSIEGLRIPGSHNQRNAAMAVATARRIAGRVGSVEGFIEAARTFRGLPHRLCLVHEGVLRDGGVVRFYDDSKSTVPGATVLAIEAMRDSGVGSRVHLIAGGYDKKVDLGQIAAQAGTLAGLYTIGATGAVLADQARGAGRVVEPCETLAAAMGAIRGNLRGGDVVLLSPGCASWDQFENYEHRGREFARLAEVIMRGAAHVA